MPPVTSTPDPLDVLRQSKQNLDQAAVFTEKAFEKGQAYNTAIILTGFGGLFALLASTKNLLPKVWLATSAALISVSLALFVGFILYNMFVMTFALLKSATTQLQNAEKVSRLAGIDTKNIEAAMRVLKINIWLWFFVWIASVGAGISAAVIMLFFYARGILQI
jgi:hypothetical protein